MHNTIEKQRAYHREYSKRYLLTPKGRQSAKAAQKKYYTSEHGKAARLAYSKTKRYKDMKRRYALSTKGKMNFRRGADKYRQTPHGRFMLARKMAIYRGKAWTLSEVYYGSLMAKPCDYCGTILNPTGIGLDRLDNKSGYHVYNVVPCCNTCNRARGDWWTPAELRAAVTAVAATRDKSNNLVSADTLSNDSKLQGPV